MDQERGLAQAIAASNGEILNAVIPPETNKLYPLPVNEHQAFIDGVKNRKPPYYTPEDIHRLSSVMHMGNIAMRLGRKLMWDVAREEFPGDDEANAMRAETMRAPWTLEG
jgi:hypothetical protein